MERRLNETPLRRQSVPKKEHGSPGLLYYEVGTLGSPIYPGPLQEDQMDGHDEEHGKEGPERQRGLQEAVKHGDGGGGTGRAPYRLEEFQVWTEPNERENSTREQNFVRPFSLRKVGEAH